MMEVRHCTGERPQVYVVGFDHAGEVGAALRSLANVVGDRYIQSITSTIDVDDRPIYTLTMVVLA